MPAPPAPRPRRAPRRPAGPLLLAAALLAVAPAGRAAAAPKLEVDKSFGRVAGWSIGFSESLSGCVAAATYGDGTTAWFGFGGDKESAFLAFTNAKWRSIEPDGRYALVLRARGQGNWRGVFTGLERGEERGLFMGGLKEAFVGDMARAGSVGVSFEGRQIAALSLSGSSEAIDAVLGCQRDYAVSRAKADGARPPGGEGGKGEGGRGEGGKGRGSQGTGFFVSERGHVLTNQHVVSGCSSIDVTTPGSPPTPARLVASDATNDLAVLSTDLKPPSVPALSLRARVGESVFVYGYPLSGLLATTGNFTIGNVTATAGLADDTRMVQISAPVQPGNSGGPLLDQYGNVVGVIVSKLNTLKFAKLTEDIAQNVNFAIKTTIALNFLEANGVSAAIDARTSGPMDGATIAERAKEFTLRVNCR